MYLLKPLFTLSLILIFTASFSSENALKSAASHEEINQTWKETATLWHSSGLDETEISLKAFYHALTGYQRLKSAYGSDIGDQLVIIDYSQPSDKKRMVVYSISANYVTYSSLVAHGRNSGEEMATSFSNRVSSYQSSLGFYLTAETYMGKHGYSLRLDGLEYGFNDNARDRAVVMHGADYATHNFIDRHGRLGRSLGCPSLPPAISTEVIDQIKEGNVMFIYAENQQYLSGSEIINFSEDASSIALLK